MNYEDFIDFINSYNTANELDGHKELVFQLMNKDSVQPVYLQEKSISNDDYVVVKHNKCKILVNFVNIPTVNYLHLQIKYREDDSVYDMLQNKIVFVCDSLKDLKRVLEEEYERFYASDFESFEVGS